MALMVASRRLAAGYWCVSAGSGKGPALLRVLRNSPRGLPCTPTPARHLMMPWGVVRFNIRRTTQQTDYKRIKHFQGYRIANSENG